MSRVDLAELRRLHEAATKGEWAVEPVDAIGRAVLRRGTRRMFPIPVNDAAFMAAAHNALPALLDELEAAREEVRRLTQANGDLRKERDRAVAEAQRQDGVAKGLRKERDQLAADNARLRAALGFYAKPEHWMAQSEHWEEDRCLIANGRNRVLGHGWEEAKAALAATPT